MGRTLYVIHGPSLNLLGTREPALYGTETLAQIDARLATRAAALGASVVCRQSNREGELIDWVHEAGTSADGILINPAGYTHTSLALADALRAVRVPAVEVHLTNLYAREPARHVSHTAAACVGFIAGFGPRVYDHGLVALLDVLSARGPA